MSADAIENFPSSFVGIPPSPADSGTALSVKPGEAVNLPNPEPFNCTVWSAGVQASRFNSEIIRVTLVPRTTVASGSNAAVLPQAIIHVADESDFPSGGGTFSIILDDDGTVQTIRFTGTAAGELTGCTGGVGTLTTGDVVTGDDLTITRQAETAGNALVPVRSILLGDQIEATITKKTLNDLVSAGGGLASVSDGIVTVAPAASIRFTSAAVVTDGGSGEAQVAIFPADLVEVISAFGQTINPSSNTALTWTYSSGSAGILDYTDSTAPTVTDTGWYKIAGTVENNAPTDPTAVISTILVCGFDNVRSQCNMSPTIGGFIQSTFFWFGKLTAGDAFNLDVFHNDSASSDVNLAARVTKVF